MSGWRTVRLGDLGRVVTGKTPPSAEPEMFVGDTPFITPSDMSDDCRHIATERFVSQKWDPKRRMLLPQKAVCVVCIGATIGKICMTHKPSHTNQQLNSIIVDDDLFDPFFVYYSLRTKVGELKANAAGAATPIINKSVFSELKIDAPCRNTQRRIASILGAYDDLIEVNRRRVKLLEEMARGLFEEWFVRFRFPGHETVPLLDTPNGKLPAKWKFDELGTLLELAYGKALKATDREPGMFPVIGSSGVVGTNVSAFEAGPGIIVGRKGNVGAIIWSPFDYWPIDTVYFVRSPLPKIFLLQLLRRVPFQNTDAAVPGLNRNTALKKIVVVPPVELSIKYDKYAYPMQQMIDGLNLANERLAASRDLLLPRLISGQLSVAAAEQQLAAE